MNSKMRIFVFLLLFSSIWISQSISCTNILVTKGATVDSSVIITYSCDGEFLPHLRYTPAADHAKDEFVEIRRRGGEVVKIPQVPHTYAVVGLINEYQLSIGETTTTGREELRNPDGALHYWTLMNLALQRAKTAREAIKVITDLVDKYGYASTAEAFSIGDPNEAWILEMIGPGPGGKGAIWVARRIPDGYVSCHANLSRIGEFPLDDPENCLYSKNVISFAVKKGYYNPKSGEPFRFNLAYCPPDPESLRYCATRVWSILRRVAPSLNLSPDFHRGVKGASSYPLWVKADQKLTTADVMSLMRDHYEGTDFDMTKGVDAGPFGCPNRWRPIDWEVDSVKYCWERPISTQQTGFSFVSQSRDHFPNPIGGVLWYGMDDTYTTCYIPLYCGIKNIPQPFARGDIRKFSWDSAWWVFNFVANFANLKYSYMVKDIQKVQRKLEGNEFKLQPVIEKTAAALYESNPDLVADYLTNYCVSNGENVVKQWRELGEALITKYNDGYVKDEKGRIQSVGYPEQWLRDVIQLRPDQFKLPQW